MDPIGYIKKRIKMKLLTQGIIHLLVFVLAKVVSPQVVESADTQDAIQWFAQGLVSMVGIVAHHYNTDGTSQRVAFRSTPDELSKPDKK